MRLLLRNLFFAFLFLLPALHGRAQKVAFCDTANQWVTTGNVDGTCAWERTVYLEADTTIAGKKYRKVAYSSLIYTAHSAGCNATMGTGFFVREDLASGMVYYRQPSKDQLEHVLYNYNLVPGDTIQYLHNMWGGSSVADSLVKLDSTLIGGVYHKVFDFQNVTGRGNRAYTVIEGVGCTNHPTYPAFAGDCHGYTESLRCFSQGGMVQDFSMRLNQCNLLGNNFYTNCDYTLTTTKVSELGVAQISIMPNPAGNRFEVSAPVGAMQYSVVAHDILGREMTKFVMTGSSHTVATNNWAPGTYFITASRADGFSTRQVVVVSR